MTFAAFRLQDPEVRTAFDTMFDHFLRLVKAIRFLVCESGQKLLEVFEDTKISREAEGICPKDQAAWPADPCQLLLLHNHRGGQTAWNPTAWNPKACGKKAFEVEIEVEVEDSEDAVPEDEEAATQYWVDKLEASGRYCGRYSQVKLLAKGAMGAAFSVCRVDDTVDDFSRRAVKLSQPAFEEFFDEAWVCQFVFIFTCLKYRNMTRNMTLNMTRNMKLNMNI